MTRRASLIVRRGPGCHDEHRVGRTIPRMPTDDHTPTHDAPPHDEHSREPLGPLTPDDETPLGDTPEAHDEITPHDLPQDHPGRQAAEREAEQGDGLVRGNQ